MKPVKTQSSRRHAFKSFRERIDSIKIEPSLDLSTRVHDYVETSHFLTTLEHWREVNLSGDFTEFLDEVESLSQTLPQILHHQKQIYTSLQKHIKNNDVNSIQPLLELLSQFIHDLGPDFMPYYPDMLQLLSELALSITPNDSQNKRNSSNVLEWCFNSLAFSFKYLSRTLAADLIPTFEILFPVLSLKKKAYVARFCAEALSYLVRKLKSDRLHAFIEHTFSLDVENDFYHNSLVTLYSESIMSTSGNFHSKASMILSSLVESSIRKEPCISCVCDILLNVINHGSPQACAKFYDLVISYLSSLLSSNEGDDDINLSVSQILTTLCFAESGKKVKSWDLLLAIVKSLLANTSGPDETLMHSFVYLFVIILRNGDVQDFTKYHKTFFDFFLNVNNGGYFLPFVEANLSTSREKLLKFGIARQIQTYVNNSSELCDVTELQKLSYFLSRLSKIEPDLLSSLIAPLTLQNGLTEEIKTIELLSQNDLYELYWRLNILSHDLSPQLQSYDFFLQLLRTLVDTKFEYQSDFSNDVVAVLIELLTRILHSSENIDITEELFTVILNDSQTFQSLQTSSFFIRATNKLFVSSKAYLNGKESKTYQKLLLQVSANLSSANAILRQNSIALIRTILDCTGQETSDVYDQIALIELIPLTVSTARDMEQRIRHLATTFKSQASHTDLEKAVMSRYIVGLLTKKFQPCWKGVFESLPIIFRICGPTLWPLIFELLTFDYSSQEKSYYREESLESAQGDDEKLFQVQPKDHRLYDNFKGIFNDYLKNYQNVSSASVHFIQSEGGSNELEDMLRNRLLQAISTVPLLAESNSKDFISLIFKSDLEDDADSASRETTWNLKDRCLLIEILSKFNNLPKVSQADKVFDHLMELLCHKKVQVQSVSLNALINWKISSINRYKDNLKNLLDDTTFKDEITNLIVSGSDSKIEEQDYPQVAPVILRILFGRVQKNKTDKKSSVLSMLPNFPEKYIIEFINIGAERTDYSAYYSNDRRPEYLKAAPLRKVLGFVNFLEELQNVLGSKYPEVLKFATEPLLFALLVSQYHIDEPSGEDDNSGKVLRSLRQIGSKCLSKQFQLLGSNFDWSEYVDFMYENIIKTRLPKFGDENSQQTSSLLRLMTGWVDFDNLHQFLFVDNFAPVYAIASLLSNSQMKELVLSVVLEFCVKALTQTNIKDDRFFTFSAILVESLLSNLPGIIERTTDKETNSKAIHILLLIIEGKYVDQDATSASLLVSLKNALEKPLSQVVPKDKVNILLSLSALIDGYDCAFEELSGLYSSICHGFKNYSDSAIRLTLVTVIHSMGQKFMDIGAIADIVDNLNAVSSKRISEPDMEKRLLGFKIINEERYLEFSPLQWAPIVNCALYFAHDEEEFAIRVNAGYTLKRFCDCFSAKKDSEEAQGYLALFNSVINPLLRIGIRHKNDEVKNGFVSILGHLVDKSQYLPEMENMKPLLGKSEDDEDNFFENVTHIQLLRRQEVLRSLPDLRNDILSFNISHYLLPIVESYAIYKDDKFRNLSDQALVTISELACRVSWGQYKALFKRYLTNLGTCKDADLKFRVNMIVAISKGFWTSTKSKSEGKKVDIIDDLPSDWSIVDQHITKVLIPGLLKVLNVRNDDTIVARAPLSEAVIYLLTCLSEDLIAMELPGLLTNTCQVMRSKSEDLRNAIRKSLGKIVKILGAKYFKFIIKELKTALSRGSQIHVLSFTLHSLLVSIQPSLLPGDLDESTDIIVDIIMEDIFGAAGQEKDAEGYHSKMKEVKFKKSFDSGELLSSNISLSQFGTIIQPLKLLLSENISHKTENYLDELIRKYAAGLNHNSASSTREILVLCFELYRQSENSKDENTRRPKRKEVLEHFAVQLNSKPLKTTTSTKHYSFALQKLSFELLKVSISRHPQLLTVENFAGFVPLLEESFGHGNEAVTIASLRVLNSVIKLPFDETFDEIFSNCIKFTLEIVRDSPSTTSEVCQASLKFLSTVVKHKSSIGLKDTAVSYVLERLQPDLEEPNKQGLAFSFLKAVISQHIMIPEVYDVMDRVAKIMVVNHNKEIQNMSRSLYFQFLMEYDQGRGRLEKQFKFLVNNLGYVTETGRQAVMELIHSIVLKCGPDLLNKLSSSFFVALANVVVADDSSKCREMASALIGQLFEKLGPENIKNPESYCHAWLSQSSNNMLRRCGLSIYKIYLSVFDIGQNKKLDSAAFEVILETLRKAQNANETTDEVLWEDVYTVLNLVSLLSSKLRKDVVGSKYKDLWFLIIDVLLFPHTWVRLSACRLIGVFLSNLDTVGFAVSDYDVQTIAYRLLRQLSAPLVPADLGNQIIKNLVTILMKWNKEQTAYLHSEEAKQEDREEVKYKSAIDFIVSRISALLRQGKIGKESQVTKVSCIQFCAMLMQILDEEKALEVAEPVILGLYNFAELDPRDSNETEKLLEMTTECMLMIQDKMGVSAYTEAYSKVKESVMTRRQDRRTKRAYLAVSAPDVAARRKLKKHERSRTNRSQKDENGFYRHKRRRV